MYIWYPAFPTGTQTINYVYDPLNRLKEANYPDGIYYHYSYDKVGNRLTASDQYSTTTYTYDDANRLASVNGVQYTYDANGNLLSDGVNSYVYDSANRLTSQTGPAGTITYAYNGLGDRLQESVNGVTTTFTVDLAAGLTQTLDDGTNAYLYGNSRIAQVNNSGSQYFLGDALGSIRQLTDGGGAVTLARIYDPYGVVSATSGAGSSSYGFTAENQDSSNGLVYLRSRFYSPENGRFETRDTWQGDVNDPLTLNKWNYVSAAPVNLSDPSGHIQENEARDAWDITETLKKYQVDIVTDWGYFKDGNLVVLLPIDPRIMIEIYGYGNCAEWKPGRWSLNELNIVKGAVLNLNAAMKDRMSSLIGPVTISKTPYACARGCTTLGHIDLLDSYLLPEEQINGNLFNYNIVNNNINFDQWTVIHELGHAWDAKDNGLLSASLVLKTGGGFGPAIGCDEENRLPGCNYLYYHYGDIPPKGSDFGFDPSRMSE